jgi:hypothetical protein
MGLNLVGLLPFVLPHLGGRHTLRLGLLLLLLSLDRLNDSVAPHTLR